MSQQLEHLSRDGDVNRKRSLLDSVKRRKNNASSGVSNPNSPRTVIESPLSNVSSSFISHANNLVAGNVASNRSSVAQTQQVTDGESASIHGFDVQGDLEQTLDHECNITALLVSKVEQMRATNANLQKLLQIQKHGRSAASDALENEKATHRRLESELERERQLVRTLEEKYQNSVNRRETLKATFTREIDQERATIADLLQKLDASVSYRTEVTEKVQSIYQQAKSTLGSNTEERAQPTKAAVAKVENTGSESSTSPTPIAKSSGEVHSSSSESTEPQVQSQERPQNPTVPVAVASAPKVDEQPIVANPSRSSTAHLRKRAGTVGANVLALTENLKPQPQRVLSSSSLDALNCIPASSVQTAVKRLHASTREILQSGSISPMSTPASGSSVSQIGRRPIMLKSTSSREIQALNDTGSSTKPQTRARSSSRNSSANELILVPESIPIQETQSTTSENKESASFSTSNADIVTTSMVIADTAAILDHFTDLVLLDPVPATKSSPKSNSPLSFSGRIRRKDSQTEGDPSPQTTSSSTSAVRRLSSLFRRRESSVEDSTENDVSRSVIGPMASNSSSSNSPGGLFRRRQSAMAATTSESKPSPFLRSSTLPEKSTLDYLGAQR